MRDKIKIYQLETDVQSSLNRVDNYMPDEAVYSKTEVDDMISNVIAMIGTGGGSGGGTGTGTGTVDLSNYYTKTQTDNAITKSVNNAIAAHDSDTASHDSAQTRISDLTQMFSNLHTEIKVFNLTINQNDQHDFTVDDVDYEPTTVLTSLLILNTNVILNYTLSGRSITLNTTDGANIGSTLSLVVISVKGV